MATETAEEFQILYRAYGAAIARAVAALETNGLNSNEFKSEDATADRLWSLLQELRKMVSRSPRSALKDAARASY